MQHCSCNACGATTTTPVTLLRLSSGCCGDASLSATAHALVSLLMLTCRPLLLEIVPLYAFRERPARESQRRAPPPLLANVSPLRASVQIEDLASRVAAAHAKLRGTSQLAAQRAFIKLCQVRVVRALGTRAASALPCLAHRRRRVLATSSFRRSARGRKRTRRVLR